MHPKNVQVSLTPELAQLLDGSGAELESRVREALVLELYQEAVISSGKAAELLDISKDSFRALLRKRGIAYFRQSLDEVVRDAKTASSLKP
jgi:predicted HTH domain antitoxin